MILKQYLMAVMMRNSLKWRIRRAVFTFSGTEVYYLMRESDLRSWPLGEQTGIEIQAHLRSALKRTAEQNLARVGMGASDPQRTLRAIHYLSSEMYMYIIK